MAKLTRKLLEVFGINGDVSDFSEFGSEVAGTPSKTKDIEVIQTLSAWTNGLHAAVYNANKAIFLEDLNSALYVFAYQIAYQMQEGMAEWNTNTTYYIGSIVKKTGTFELYGSLTDNNAGNALGSRADNTNWKYLCDLAAMNSTASTITSGTKDSFNVGSFANLNASKYVVNLPTAGTYFIFARLRYLAELVGGYTDFANCQLFNQTLNQAIPGTIVQLAENQNQYSNICTSTFWIVTVTGATTIYLQGKSSTSNQHYIQDDLNGRNLFGYIKLQ